MFNPYNLLEDVLNKIESDIKENINADILAEQFSISSVHLQRLFKFAFNYTIGSYIRSRKLAVSLEDLLNKAFNILDISLEYGFEYERTYIRAFKQEFGITPGKMRKTGNIVKITPPINFHNAKKAENGILFGPEIVMVPKFHVIGKLYQLPGSDLAALTPKMAKEFWDNEHGKINNATDPDVLYIGLARNYNFGEGIADYLASVPVKNLKNIPEGFTGDTFETSLCARFWYIGKHHYNDLHREIMQPMYNEIYRFRTDENEKYSLLNDKVYIEKIDARQYDGTYCQMEWFAPVKEKL